MKEFKGTPSPWEYEADNGWECMITTSKETHYIEVKNHDMAEDACIEMYHNAKLIEQAPEMLDALQYAVEVINATPIKDSLGGQIFLKKAEEIIIKALGA